MRKMSKKEGQGVKLVRFCKIALIMSLVFVLGPILFILSPFVELCFKEEENGDSDRSIK